MYLLVSYKKVSENVNTQDAHIVTQNFPNKLVRFQAQVYYQHKKMHREMTLCWCALIYHDHTCQVHLLT